MIIKGFCTYSNETLYNQMISAVKMEQFNNLILRLSILWVTNFPDKNISLVWSLWIWFS